MISAASVTPTYYWQIRPAEVAMASRSVAPKSMDAEGARAMIRLAGAATAASSRE